ncbi:hypothetical protein Ddye_019753 [Dipteronia dyeriana]|uniref:Chaperonin-like RBCX protein 1, chloroplastic n=1 Tax=Dipteronia dyeriana TaxID=168575 RepID=A0AAD9TZD9_9ROSI|nr:hypothetical protein Ddye_019753 [Dipteronia dyeriana]
METYAALLPLAHPCTFFPSKINRKSNKKPFPSRITPLNCQKMYVPGFGEASPEAKAAKNLHDFFNYVAVRIVSSQLEDYNKEAYEELMDFLSKNSLNDGDKFCADLMRESPRHKGLALRILEVSTLHVVFHLFLCNRFRIEHYVLKRKTMVLYCLQVRSAYCKNDFEWDNMKRLALKMVDDSNTRLMRDYVLETSHESDK